jgi:hypothetical protein
MKTITTVIYVANDGKKFLDRYECCLYEKKVTNLLRRENWIEGHYADLVETAKSIDSDAFVPLSGSNLFGGGFGVVGTIALYQSPMERRTTIINLKTGRCGKAICNSNDNFDSKTGWAVAWARYRGETIPDYI